MSDNKTVKVELPKEEAKKERTMNDVQQEFSTLCTRLGHLQYQVYIHGKDSEILSNQMRDLNFEAASIQAKAQKTKEEEESK